MSDIKLVPELDAENPHKVYIFSAIPGSGKSTQAQLMVEKHGPKQCSVVSADHYFIKYDPETKTSEYKFNPRELPKAHKRCKQFFVRELGSIDRRPIVIVDNTNVDPIQAAFYYEYADLEGYDVEVIRFIVDPDVAFERQIHNVPRESFWRMYNAFRDAKWPRYWNVRNITL